MIKNLCYIKQELEKNNIIQSDMVLEILSKNVLLKVGYYEIFRENQNFKSFWRFFETNDFSDKSTYQSAKVLRYYQHFADECVEVNIDGNTWKDLYIAAESAIIRSHDTNHLYIKNFQLDALNHEVLILFTGLTGT